MRRLTGEQRRNVVMARLAEHVLADRVFRRRIDELQEKHPQCFPWSNETPSAGIPMSLALDLAVLARDLGLDHLPTPWLLIAQRVLDTSRSWEFPVESASTETWQRRADWFIEHFRWGDTVVSIAKKYS